MNAQAEIKGISTDTEANAMGLKNHNSQSTYVLQPEVPIQKSGGGFLISSTCSGPQKCKVWNTPGYWGVGGRGHGPGHHPASLKQLLFKTGCYPLPLSSLTISHQFAAESRETTEQQVGAEIPGSMLHYILETVVCLKIKLLQVRAKENTVGYMCILEIIGVHLLHLSVKSHRRLPLRSIQQDQMKHVYVRHWLLVRSLAVYLSINDKKSSPVHKQRQNEVKHNYMLYTS